MSRHSFKTTHLAGAFGHFPARLNRLLLYSVVIFLVRFADAIMSYFSPIYIQSFANPMTTGIILSSSSIFGLVCDFMFGKLFPNKDYRFFLAWGIMIGVLFPLTFLILPHQAMFFLISMIIWGAYFELLLFSNFHFINHAMDHHHHDTGWSVLQLFISLAYMIAPLVASFLVGFNPSYALYVAILFFALSAIMYQAYRHRFKKRNLAPHLPFNQPKVTEMIHLWQILSKKIWPVLAFILVIWMLDAVFWNAGAIISEQLTQQGFLGGILFIAYLFPALFMGFLANKISLYAGKKKTAYISGIFAGIFFSIAGIITQPILLIGIIFVGSIFIAIAVPEINGTMEDYIDRLGKSSNMLVSLESATTSVSYIIGPILVGVVATFANYQFSFTIMGILITLTSLLALFLTPRKIRLPQKQIQKVETMS